jgi:hemoglobin
VLDDLFMTAEQTQQTLFDLIGGDAKVRELVDRFYDLMDLEPEFAGIRALHPTTLEGSRDKLYWFLSGWMGGPNLYIERFGHPRLRARHLPYAIASDERDQWLSCMSLAMQEVGLSEQLQEGLMHAFYQTADWMRNREG